MKVFIYDPVSHHELYAFELEDLLKRVELLRQNLAEMSVIVTVTSHRGLCDAEETVASISEFMRVPSFKPDRDVMDEIFRQLQTDADTSRG